MFRVIIFSWSGITHKIFYDHVLYYMYVRCMLSMIPLSSDGGDGGEEAISRGDGVPGVRGGVPQQNPDRDLPAG